MKILIATYSWSGRTARLADQIADRLPNADHYLITVPEGTYSATDMYATSDQATRQLTSGNYPPLVNPLPNLATYDLILVGSPVWSGHPAVPVRVFLSQLDNFKGALAPFYTDAGSAGNFEAVFVDWAGEHQVLAGQENQVNLDNWINMITKAK